MRYPPPIPSILALGFLALLSACDRPERDLDSNTSDAEPSNVAQSGTLRARATIVGSGIKGEVTFVELQGNRPSPGVEVKARITGRVGDLTPGPHGLHIHQTGKGGCVASYDSAGGHFDPGPSGNPDPDANHPYHLGDLPNLVVDQRGVGVMEATTSRITLSPGPLSLFDSDGSAVIVHGKPDQGISGPPQSGVSGGPRIACGVIELEN
jgi:superoxide dismutase, Cu-Zn family